MEKGAVELAPLPSPGFYSRLFVVMKASGSWRPVIDLSLLNLRVQKTSFKMETLRSVLLSVRAGDWMVSLDLKDAYLQVPMHPESRKFLRFVACGKIYQFKVLCFGLSMAPQVFTGVMAPVSAFLHRSGIRLRRYLDDWLIQASSREQVLLALESVLQLCHSLGIIFDWEKSQLIPSQCVVYLGVLLDSVSFRASPAPKRVEKLLSIGEEFLSCERQPVSSWLELLGVLASLIQLVPGWRLQMQSLQFILRRSWDQTDQSILVRWTPEIRRDLEWWLDRDRLELGIALDQVSPQQELWSDASDVGWGAHLGEDMASGLWSPGERSLSINARELLLIILLPPPVGYLPTSPLALMLRVIQLTVFCSDISCFYYMSVSCPSGLCFSASLPLVTSQVRLESDVLEPQPGVTAGFAVCSRLWVVRTGILRSLLTSLNRLGFM